MFKSCGLAGDSLWFGGNYSTVFAGFFTGFGRFSFLSSFYALVFPAFFNKTPVRLTSVFPAFSSFSTALTIKETYLKKII